MRARQSLVLSRGFYNYFLPPCFFLSDSVSANFADSSDGFLIFGKRDLSFQILLATKSLLSSGSLLSLQHDFPTPSHGAGQPLSQQTRQLQGRRHVAITNCTGFWTGSCRRRLDTYTASDLCSSLDEFVRPSGQIRTFPFNVTFSVILTRSL